MPLLTRHNDGPDVAQIRFVPMSPALPLVLSITVMMSPFHFKEHIGMSCSKKIVGLPRSSPEQATCARRFGSNIRRILLVSSLWFSSSSLRNSRPVLMLYDRPPITRLCSSPGSNSLIYNSHHVVLNASRCCPMLELFSTHQR
jgi:hypothetical protein